MFEEAATAEREVAGAVGAASVASAGGSAPLSTAELRSFLARLSDVDREVDDGERVTQLGLLESIKAAAAGVQAVVTVDFEASRVAVRTAQGVPPEQCGRGVSDEVALARRESKHRGSRHLGVAKALILELPHTMAGLLAGEVTEWRASIMCRETALLSADLRREVDARLASTIASMGDLQLERAARGLALELDDQLARKRARGARGDRRVTIRPAPDTMTYLTGLLPVEQGVAVYAALDREAKAAASNGDTRCRGQVMADTLVERVTGQVSADAVPIEVHLVMTDAALLAGASTPAVVPGHGPVPAGVARDLIAGQDESTEEGRQARVWVRRLFTTPDGNHLVSMDSRRRRFAGLLRRMLVLRDQTCRTPWCDAPIRHGDHATPTRAGGPTEIVNGQGLCERCNYAKEEPGWRADHVLPDHVMPGDHVSDRSRAGPRWRGHTVVIATPSGHTYRSTAPPILGHGIDVTCTGQRALDSPLERHLHALTIAA